MLFVKGVQEDWTCRDAALSEEPAHFYSPSASIKASAETSLDSRGNSRGLSVNHIFHKSRGPKKRGIPASVFPPEFPVPRHLNSRERQPRLVFQSVNTPECASLSHSELGHARQHAQPRPAITVSSSVLMRALVPLGHTCGAHSGCRRPSVLGFNLQTALRPRADSRSCLIPSGHRALQDRTISGALCSVSPQSSEAAVHSQDDCRSPRLPWLMHAIVSSSLALTLALSPLNLQPAQAQVQVSQGSHCVYRSDTASGYPLAKHELTAAGLCRQHQQQRLPRRYNNSRLTKGKSGCCFSAELPPFSVGLCS